MQNGKGKETLELSNTLADKISELNRFWPIKSTRLELWRGHLLPSSHPNARTDMCVTGVPMTL